MHKLIIIILAFFLSTSSCQKQVNNFVNEKTIVEWADTLNKTQLDSLFITDTLSFDIEDDWIQSQAISEDKAEILYKYVYIKELTDSIGILYTLYSYQDTLYIINKRVVE
jgi:hypothetical protein